MTGAATAGTGDNQRSRGDARVPTGPNRRLPAEERRSQLFDVALSLFAERGFAATTMDHIAEAAGVTKPLVYQHFDSKRALYLELMDVISKRMATAIATATASAPGPRQQVKRGFSAYFTLMVENEQAFALLYGRDAPNDHELGAALRRVEDTIAEVIDPLIDADLEVGHRLLLAYAVVGMAEGVSRHWVDSRRARAHSDGGVAPQPAGGDEAERLAAQLADLAWAGLRQVHPL